MFEPSEADTFASMLERLIAENSLTANQLALHGSQRTLSLLNLALQCCQLNGRFVQYVFHPNKKAVSMDFLLL